MDGPKSSRPFLFSVTSLSPPPPPMMCVLPFYAGQRLTFTLPADIHQNTEIKCWLLWGETKPGNGNTCVVSNPMRMPTVATSIVGIYTIYPNECERELSTYANWNANKPCRLYRRFMFKSPTKVATFPFVFRILLWHALLNSFKKQFIFLLPRLLLLLLFLLLGNFWLSG